MNIRIPIPLLLLLASVSGHCLEPLPSHNPFSKPGMLKAHRGPATARTAVVEPTAALPTVKATLVGGATPMALINDKVVVVGDDVNGYRLVAVREGVAVFERDGEIAEVGVRRDPLQGIDTEDES